MKTLDSRNLFVLKKVHYDKQSSKNGKNQLDMVVAGIVSVKP
jgi:hypothetical protein